MPGCLPASMLNRMLDLAFGTAPEHRYQEF